jgi:hypothetical protein
LVNSLYKAAFGRLAEPEGLANRIHQLQSGVSLEVLAEEFVGSPEFQTRHGTSRSVDTKYLTVLYRDGLGLKADLKHLAHWLAEGKKGSFHFSVARDHGGTFERSSLVCAGAVAASRARVDRGWIRKSRSATGGLNLDSECGRCRWRRTDEYSRV